VRLARHARVAISKRSSEVRQRHHEELCKEGTEANLRILALFERDPQIKLYVPIAETLFMTLIGTFVGREKMGERDPQIKLYVPIAETLFMTLIGTFVGREKMGEHNPQACYDLYDSVRSRAGIPDIDGDGLNGALSIHRGVIGVSSGRQTYYCIICKRELQPNTSHRDHSRLVEIGNPLGRRRCQRCDRFFKDYGEERTSSTDGSCHTESSRENNINYGLLQDMLTSAEILFVQHLVSQGLVFLAGWRIRGVKIVLHS
jgi:hypothetical protein